MILLCFILIELIATFFNFVDCYICYILLHVAMRCTGSHRHGLELCHADTDKSPACRSRTGGCARPGRPRTPDTICSSDTKKHKNSAKKVFSFDFWFGKEIHIKNFPDMPHMPCFKSSISEFLSTTTVVLKQVTQSQNL